MTTNTTPSTTEVCEETIGYFRDNFQHEALLYVRRDLLSQIDRSKTNYNFLESQARQFASMAQAELDRIEGLKYELASVNTSIIRNKE